MLLIISPNRKIAKSVADTFYFMSILGYGTTIHDALSEISELYRAVLIINPSNFPDIKDYVKRLKSYKSDIPVFALADEDVTSSYANIFDGYFTNATFTPALASKIIAYANKNNKAKIGDYRLAGFDASSSVVGVNYFHKKINLTKTEAMILRYLIRSYPVPQRAEDILKYAFRTSRAPEPSSIRTHISIMNKKFDTIIGRKMVVLSPHKGYRILTPEHIEYFITV